MRAAVSGMVWWKRSPYGPMAAGAAGLVGVGVVAGATGFLEPASFLITVIGPLGVLLATYGRERIGTAWQDLRDALAPAADVDVLVQRLKALGRLHRVEGTPALEQAVGRVDDAVVRHAFTTALELESEPVQRAALRAAMRRDLAEIEHARQVLATLGKLFPAFGLIGTLIGLALLLRNLGGTNVAAIGPGLAIAVMTTLYGAVLANVVVLPLATKLGTHVAREALRRELIVEGVLLVMAGEYPSQIERVLRAHAKLPPAPRPVPQEVRTSRAA
ncbi:MAG: MotA/TolQ/ExbB proton channel family protein [bacterium]|nr:MotA/TolQ/ExbB proton channel family protein [bacterium]